jgi:biotin-(acetyl-CoA carboxylase) ligase
LRETAASLATVLGHDVDINATAALCVAGIHGACEQYAADIAAGGTGLDAAFHARWSKRDALAGNAIRARIAGSAAGSSAAGSTDTAGALAAIAVGISATGALLVRDAAGTVHALNSGEVTLAPAT